MTNKEKLIFGQRNKDLCAELHKQGKYYDWVVTTAFYSAIHYIEGKILPTKVNNKQCANIFEVKDALAVDGRHQARSRLVHKCSKNFQIAAAYDWLDEQSRNSRYKTYKVNKNIADKAVYYLNLIADYCSVNA